MLNTNLNNKTWTLFILFSFFFCKMENFGMTIVQNFRLLKCAHLFWRLESKVNLQNFLQKKLSTIGYPNVDEMQTVFLFTKMISWYNKSEQSPSRCIDNLEVCLCFPPKNETVTCRKSWCCSFTVRFHVRHLVTIATIWSNLMDVLFGSVRFVVLLVLNLQYN